MTKQNPVQSSKFLHESEYSTDYLPVLSLKKLRDILINKQSSSKEKSKYLTLNVDNLLYLYAELFVEYRFQSIYFFLSFVLNICCLTRVLFVVHKLVVVLKISENYLPWHLGTLFDLYYLYFRKNSTKLSFNYKIFKRYKKKSSGFLLRKLN